MFGFDMFSSVCSHRLFYREDRSTNNRLMYDSLFYMPRSYIKLCFKFCTKQNFEYRQIYYK